MPEPNLCFVVLRLNFCEKLQGNGPYKQDPGNQNKGKIE